MADMQNYCDNEGVILIFVFSVQIVGTNCLGIACNADILWVRRGTRRAACVCKRAHRWI